MRILRHIASTVGGVSVYFGLAACDWARWYDSEMIRRGTPFFLAGLALLASSCAPTAAPDMRAAEEAAIRATDEQWSATAAKNDLAGTVAFYADDAVMLPPNAPISRDAKAIHDSWAGLLTPHTTLSWKVTKVEVAKSGELGYLYGTYELSMQDPVVHDTGKMVEVWKKQTDGKWKCIVDTYNSDLPLPGSTDGKK
jgi:ketosteroid isomerase-like protein